MLDRKRDGVDEVCDGPLPTMDDVPPGSRQLKGIFVCEDTGEAVFVAPPNFQAQPALWRIDILQDLIYDFERLRRAALLEWEQELAALAPRTTTERRARCFRAVCDDLGISIPEDIKERLRKRIIVQRDDGLVQ